VSQTGLGANAQAAGERAQALLNPDGSLNQAGFEAATAGIVEKAQGILKAANQNERKQLTGQFNEMYRDTPLARGVMGRIFDQDQGGARLGGVVEMAKGNHIDNTRVAGYEAAIREGSMFGGHRIGDGENGESGGSVAKVLAYYAATVGQNGQALSERQVADMQSTFASLTPIEQFVVREQIAKWDSDNPNPSELVTLLPQAARGERDLGNLGGAPTQVPQNSLREYDRSGGEHYVGMDAMGSPDTMEIYSEKRKQQERDRGIREGYSTF